MKRLANFLALWSPSLTGIALGLMLLYGTVKLGILLSLVTVAIVWRDNQYGSRKEVRR
jgi:hypothetical protein